MKFRRILFFLLLSQFGLAQNQLILEKLPDEINSTLFDEIGPVISHDGQTVYFTRVGYPEFNKTLIINDQNLYLSLPPKQYKHYLAKVYSQISGINIKYAQHSEYNQDVWIAHLKNNEFYSLEHPPTPLNNALPNSICSLTPFQNTFLILNQFIPTGGMDQGFSSIQKLDNKWHFPEPISIENYYTKGDNVNLTMSPDGEVLILSLQRADSYGQNDLYISFKNGIGGWTEPMNLGPSINSSASEETPSISADNKTLYFSSNRNDAFGGKDIFRAERNSDNWTDWTSPRRFIAPINSSKDDSQPFFNYRTGYLYFSSNRAGSFDIYRIKIAPPKPDEILVKGKIIHAITQQIMKAKVLYGSIDIGHFQRYYISQDGTFEFRMPKDAHYKLKAEKDQFISSFQIIENKKGIYYPIRQVKLFLTPLVENALIKTSPIYFEKSKAIFLEKSMPALASLFQIVKENPNIHLRIEGHTENRGKTNDLIKLSEDRARAVKSYLIKQGIEEKRIQTKGYGASRPAKPNKNEVMRQKNRRVEIRITKIN